ncbi:MAG: MoaD family protein [Sulfolobales archaeon]|nr:MoaD family protein [Sulfolobales archaeon]MDW7969050.1 MoaD family protein [Sulfolobales archaeon]
MKVRVRYYALFRELARRSEEVILTNVGASLKDVLSEISMKYPKLGNFISSGAYIILWNSRPVSDKELNLVLDEDDVIDIMPPPSGGSIEVRLLRKEDSVSIDELIKEIKELNGVESCGALAIYIGFVKGVVDGVKVNELTYEVNEEYTLKSLNNILDEVLAKHRGVIAVKVFHRVGSYRQGDEVLYVVVVGRGRRDVMPALTEIVERIKHETAIWKLERRDDGNYWVLGDGLRVKSEVNP